MCIHTWADILVYVRYSSEDIKEINNCSFLWIRRLANRIIGGWGIFSWYVCFYCWTIYPVLLIPSHDKSTSLEKMFETVLENLFICLLPLIIFTKNIDVLIYACVKSPLPTPHPPPSALPGLCKLVIQHLSFGSSHLLGLLGCQIISSLVPMNTEALHVDAKHVSHNWPVLFGLQCYYHFSCEMRSFTVSLLLPPAVITACQFLSPASKENDRGFVFSMPPWVIKSLVILPSRNLTLLVYIP